MDGGGGWNGLGHLRVLAQSLAMPVGDACLSELRVGQTPATATNAKLDETFHTNVCVLGSGSYGSAIGSRLARKLPNVQIWGRDESVVQEINVSNTNSHYLPGALELAGCGKTADKRSVVW